MLCIDKLYSGGVITNYLCSSECKHCLYGCSRSWPNDYITSEDAETIFKTIKRLGCYSIHVGGGEPFLNKSKLFDFLQIAQKCNVVIEYIETNSSWYNKNAESVLAQIADLGVNTLLLSISPFHNEYIPLGKVKGLIQACNNCGINVFPWIADFYHDIDSFDETVTHAIEEYKEKFGGRYFLDLPHRYSLTMRGRSLKTFKDSFPKIKLEKLLADNQCGCSELSNVSHFHIDLYKNYIPGLCTGLAIRLEDLGKPLNEEEYPVISVLHDKGINGLLEWAVREHGFAPREYYVSKCHLCYDIRRFLVMGKGIKSKELQPVEYYKQLGVI